MRARIVALHAVSFTTSTRPFRPGSVGAMTPPVGRETQQGTRHPYTASKIEGFREDARYPTAGNCQAPSKKVRRPPKKRTRLTRIVERCRDMTGVGVSCYDRRAAQAGRGAADDVSKGRVDR